MGFPADPPDETKALGGLYFKGLGGAQNVDGISTSEWLIGPRQLTGLGFYISVKSRWSQILRNFPSKLGAPNNWTSYAEIAVSQLIF